MEWHSGEIGHGPFHKVLQVLSQIGWSIARPPVVVDHEGLCFDLLSEPQGLLRRRLDAAWLRHVALSHAHRPPMAGMCAIDPSLLRQDVGGLTALDNARLSALRSGAFLFDAEHAKYDCTKTGLCPRCAVPDTRQHRVCECPDYGDIRAPRLWICQRWPHLPPCLTHHLLPPANPHLVQFRRLLNDLPDLSGSFFSTRVDLGKQHLFTDGSCMMQTPEEFALAAWGVLNATTGCTLSSGPVPGLLQSSPRAELWALISALKWGLKVRVSIVIWTDSLKGAEGIRRLLEDATWMPKLNTDLWKQIADLVSCYTADSLDIQHVPSHLLEVACEAPLEDWLACWNNKVDVLAGQTNQNRSFDLVDVHAKALAYHQRVTEEMRALRAIYFGIAERTAHKRGMPAVEYTLEEDSEDLAFCVTDHRLHEEVPLNWFVQASCSCSELPRSFVQQACQFLVDQDMSSSQCTDVSWVELLVMLLVSGRVHFPSRCSVTGVWKERQSLPLPPNMTFAVQLSLLRSVWKRSLGSALLNQFQVKGLDRGLIGVHFPVDGLRIGCDLELLLRARQHFAAWASPPVRTVGQLARQFHF